MNILDENILESQRQVLRRWNVPFRQIGYEIEQKGMADDTIIPLLLTLRQPAFFTMDSDFFKRHLCHARYGLVFLDVDEMEAAAFIRRLLRHPAFDTHTARMGVVVRIAHPGIDVWRIGDMHESHLTWVG